MENVKIAIIDSGIDIKNKYIMRYVIGKKSFLLSDDLSEIIEGSEIYDDEGHGTACAYTILRRNENVEIMPIKIIDELGRTNSKCLLKALEFLVHTDIKLINISLATVNFDYEKEFLKVCNELVLRGKIIVASMDNRYRDSLPSKLDSVVGVRGKNMGLTDEYWYNNKVNIQCICDNEPIVVPSIKKRAMSLFGYNSKATAVMTANISKILNLNNEINYDRLNILLEKDATRMTWIDQDLIDDESDYSVKEKLNLESDVKGKIDLLCKLIIDTYSCDINIEDIYNCSLFSSITNMNKHNFYYLLYEIENKFNIKLDYDKISLKTFKSIYSLLELIMNSRI